MIAALIKAAIFYWLFITIRKFLKNSGVLSNAKTSSGPNPSYSQQNSYKTNSGPNDDDVIEADYRVIK